MATPSANDSTMTDQSQIGVIGVIGIGAMGMCVAQSLLRNGGRPTYATSILRVKPKRIAPARSFAPLRKTLLRTATSSSRGWWMTNKPTKCYSARKAQRQRYGRAA